MNGGHKFLNRYRIQSARLKDFDYSSDGAYFITICTQNRIQYFGNVVDGKIYLSEIGKIVRKFWHEIPKHFSGVHLDNFIVMPNHIHGILIINKNSNFNDCVETPKLGVSTSIKKWKSGCLGLIIN